MIIIIEICSEHYSLSEYRHVGIDVSIYISIHMRFSQGQLQDMGFEKSLRDSFIYSYALIESLCVFNFS